MAIAGRERDGSFTLAGIDHPREMVAAASRRFAEHGLVWAGAVEGDVTTFEPCRTFDRVYGPWRTIAYAKPPDRRRRFLRHRRLVP